MTAVHRSFEGGRATLPIGHEGRRSEPGGFPWAYFADRTRVRCLHPCFVVLPIQPTPDLAEIKRDRRIRGHSCRVEYQPCCIGGELPASLSDQLIKIGRAHV